MEGDSRAAAAAIPSGFGLRSCWNEVDGLPMHSRCADGVGGIPFLLVHGLVISSVYMAPLARSLSARADAHALDLPGFGASAGPAQALTVPQLAQAVLRWMTAAGIPRCHLVGNSLGCQIAAHCAVQAPERIVTLSLIGVTIDPAAHHVVTQTVRLLRDSVREPWRLWGLWLRDFFRAGLGRALATTRAMFADRVEEQLAAITVPTLIIRGDGDPTMPAEWAHRAARLVRDSELVEIPGAPHCVHFTHPEEIAELIWRHVVGSSGVADTMTGAVGAGR